MNFKRYRAGIATALLLGGVAHAEEDRDLDGMAVIGSQELPKALYIVPWKDSELAEEHARIGHGLSEDPLQPLDRGVFERELRYRGHRSGH